MVKSLVKPGVVKKAEEKERRAKTRALKLQVNREKLIASICRDSFADFVKRFWDVVVPQALVWNWHMQAICEVLQESAERVFRGEETPHDIVINVPPGTSKSTICSVMFPAWVWTRMPSCRSLCASYADNLAMDLSRKSRDLVQSEQWARLFGEMKLRDDQNAKSYFMNEAGGFRYCVGTNGSVTGFHGHFIIVDDPIDPNRAFSEAELKAANRWVSDTLKSRKVDKKVTVTILIMQRLHQNDPSAVLLKKSRQQDGTPVKHVCLPAEITKRDEVRPRKLARLYQDGLLDFARMPKKTLRQMRVDMGEYAYSGQMLQRPVPPGGGMFKIGRLAYEEAPPAIEFVKRVRYWDKAGTEGGGAYTVGALLGLDRRGRYWVLHVVRGQWDAGEREKVMESTAVMDGKDVLIGIEQEPGSGGKESAENSAKRLAGYRVRLVRPTGSKVLRADTFAVQVNVGNVVIAKGPWNEPYTSELQFFPKSTFKDQVDASSGAFGLLAKPLKRIGALPKSGPVEG